jgi:hypothetical protein
MNNNNVKVMSISSMLQGAAAYPTPMMFDPTTFVHKTGVGTASSTLKHYPN